MKSNSFDESVDLGLLTQTLEVHDIWLARMRDLELWSSTMMREDEWKSQPLLWEDGAFYKSPQKIAVAGY